jgi:hypothetical protein
MTSQFKRALLAAGVTALAAFAAASPAQAGWMTGNGMPPVWTTNDPCRNGMIWTYGTFVSGAWPPSQPSVTIHDLALVKMGYSDAPVEPLLAANVVYGAATFTVPQQELVLPSTFVLIPPEFFPVDGSGNHRVNRLDFSRTFHFKFKKLQTTGTGLRMLWRPTATFPYFLRTGTYYQVQNCWIATVSPRPRSGLEMYLSGLGAYVAKAELPTLRVRTAQGHLQSVANRAEDVDGDSVKDLVYEFEPAGKLRCRADDEVVLSPATPPADSPGC